MIDKINRVLVFGAHPDDEIIGSGGLIRKLADLQKEVYVLTFTGGETSAKSPEEFDAMLEQRAREMSKADGILGIKERIVLPVPTQQCYAYLFGSQKIRIKGVQSEISALQACVYTIREIRPDLLLTHSADNHIDHRGIAEISSIALQDADSNKMSEILGRGYKVPLAMRFSIKEDLNRVDYVIALTPEELEAKVKAMGTQGSQEKMKPLQELIETRAKYLGSKFGCGLAEGYELLRPVLIK